jgi:HK97 gp10 family phage protein
MSELRNDNFALTGFENLYKTIADIKVDVRFKGGRAAGRKCANFMAERVKERAEKLDDPSTSEKIAANVAVRFSSRLFKAKGDIGFRVGIMGGARQYSNSRDNQRRGRAGQTYETGGDKGNPGGDTWYWRLREFGTETSAASPFMRPAMASAVPVIPGMFASEYMKGLDRLLARANRQNR